MSSRRHHQLKSELAEGMMSAHLDDVLQVVDAPSSPAAPDVSSGRHQQEEAAQVTAPMYIRLGSAKDTSPVLMEKMEDAACMCPCARDRESITLESCLLQNRAISSWLQRTPQHLANVFANGVLMGVLMGVLG